MARPTIPVTIIGGYLGAGKTTLLNALLNGGAERRLAVLVNDFGAIEIDAALIEGADGGVVSLANGCVCCSVGDDLTFAMMDLLDRRPLPEHIVIEASGIAEPARIRGILSMIPGLKVEGTLVLADATTARQLGNDKQLGALIKTQLSAGDLLILTKADLVNERNLRITGNWLAEEFPDAGVVMGRHGQLPTDLVLGTKASRDATEFPPHTHSHGHDAEEIFASTQFETDRLFDRAKFQNLFDDPPNDLLRAKGFVSFSDNPGQPELLQLVGRRWSLQPRPQDAAIGRACQLVFIALAESFEAEAFNARLAAALVTAE